MHPPINIAIIGGGPAGLIAAERLAGAGCRVTVYDRMPSLGRKFLMAGHGGLNLTHSEPLASFLPRYGTAEAWLTPTICAFPPEALRAWCEGLGQENFVGSSGRVFPRVMKAAPLLRAWLRRLDALGVRFVARHRWEGWDTDALHFTDAAGESLRVAADATLLALGGASWPRLGADGSWMDILAAEGVSLAPLRPANMGFLASWSEHFTLRFAGTPLKSLRLTHGEASHAGEIMMTARGLEGGGIYALSAALRDTIEREGAATLRLDLRPGMTPEALARKLRAPRGAPSLSNLLRKAGFPPVVAGLLREVSGPEWLTTASPAALAARLKDLPIVLTESTGLARAISTAGGVRQEALTADFMLRARPGTFVAGEMLDWEAPTGGYLLQACFSTAMAAAEGMLRYGKGAPAEMPA